MIITITFQIVRRAPRPAGMNQIMFINGTSSGSWTIKGVQNCPMTMPIGLLIPKSKNKSIIGLVFLMLFASILTRWVDLSRDKEVKKALTDYQRLVELFWLSGKGN